MRLVDAAALLVAVAELSALPQLSETPVQSQNTPLPPSCRLVSFIIPGDRRTLRLASASSKLVRVLVWTEGSGAVLRDGGGSERGGTATKLTDY